MKNCTSCTRWRPITDFGYVVHRRNQYGEKVYIRNVCYLCERERRTITARINRDEFYREQARISASTKRRMEGKPEKPLTGLKTRKAQKLESQRKARRKAGIPVRPIGNRNRGKYGKHR